MKFMGMSYDEFVKENARINSIPGAAYYMPPESRAAFEESERRLEEAQKRLDELKLITVAQEERRHRLPELHGEKHRVATGRAVRLIGMTRIDKALEYVVKHRTQAKKKYGSEYPVLYKVHAEDIVSIVERVRMKTNPKFWTSGRWLFEEMNGMYALMYIVEHRWDKYDE